MLRLYRTALLALLVPASAAAQANPFALTSGPVKSAYLVYDATSKGQPMSGSTAELAMSGQNLVVRMNIVAEFEGQKMTMKVLIVEKGDSVYKLTDDEGEVSPNLRPLLSKEFEALDRGGKERLLANLKLVGSRDYDELTPAFTGEKTGTETVAGHRCDVYKVGKETMCVLPNAPSIPLSMTDEQGMTFVAKKVSLNAPVPPTLATLPKGIRWKKQSEVENGELALELWRMNNPNEYDPPAPAALARSTIQYLASPAAAKGLKEMHSGMGGGEETGEAGEGEDDSEE